MEGLQKKIDGLVMEIKDLRKQKEEGIEDTRRLRVNVRDRDEQIRQQNENIQDLSGRVSRLKKQLEAKEKKIKSIERAIRTESRRKELFNSKLLGSSKVQSDYYISLEMKLLNERFEIMKRFILVLSQEFGFDPVIFDQLLKIADEFDDPVIRVFLSSIISKKENIRSPDITQDEKYSQSKSTN